MLKDFSLEFCSHFHFSSRHTAAGASPYRFGELGAIKSDDGWVTAIDGWLRQNLYTSRVTTKEGKGGGAATKTKISGAGGGASGVAGGKDRKDQSQSRRGENRLSALDDAPFRLDHSVGESAIANSVLPNVFRPRDARVLLAGGHVRRVAVGRMAALQRRGLVAVGLEGLEPADVVAKLAEMASTSKGVARLEAAGLHINNPSCKVLMKTGVPIASFG